MEFKDYYQTLGVEKSASQDEIKKAFRKLARKYHPDVSKEADAAAKMAQLNEANTVLSDPEKRAAYDSVSAQAAAQGARGGGEFRPPPGWDTGFEFSGGPSEGGGGGDYSDFFEQLFGQAARQRGGAGSAGGFGQGGGHAARRGSDHHAKIELDLLDAYQGGTRTLSLRAARPGPDGRMVSEERNLEVKIPKGVREGQLIRLASQGAPGMGDAPAGDLFLEVHFRPDARWRSVERDVYQPLPLAPWEAALGASVEVQTPSGTVEVTVPARSRAGRKLRLKGRGIPSATPGDLYLEVDIALPPADSDAARAAWTALGKAFPTFNPRTISQTQQGA